MMPKRSILLFDTTLRDGTQGEGICFSAEDKLRIARRLDAFGIHYIEGGWPGSNPNDLRFFEKARREHFRHARIVAFGSTMRSGGRVEEDANVRALLEAETPAVSVFGKTWLLHVEQALAITPDENLHLIRQTVAYLKAHGREVIYDAEHFFDGYKSNPGYAVATLKEAARAGADVLTLCDTNGGTLPGEIGAIVTEVARQIDTPLGIHTHNDGELAVANSIAAVQAGCVLVQGTVNGYGERCGNANLCSIIPNLQLKLGYDTVPAEHLPQLTSLSHFVSELANMAPASNQAFTGKSAFAHKGGIHVSAVMKNPETYEHITPEVVGNERRVLVSDLSGRSNVLYKAKELDIDMDVDKETASGIVKQLKDLENEGYNYEAADGSLDLLIRRHTGSDEVLFGVEGFRLLVEKDETNNMRSEATIRLSVQGVTEHTAAEGCGPVHALDMAMRKALSKFFPEISDMQLNDYKVRVLNEQEGTRARVRVLIDSGCKTASWGTVGVSDNIIDASWQALMDSYAYFLHHHAEIAHINIKQKVS
jgi:2-isopropylmalate synthase